MATLFFVNLVIQGGSVFFFYYVYQQESDHILQEQLQDELPWLLAAGISGILFILAVITYLYVCCRDPGYSKSIEIRRFYDILDRAIKEKRNLDYFCFFCRCLMSYSSSHCIICRKCVEGFDHHCAFVNNCIGYRNHGAFFIFLFTALFYLLAQMFTDVWVAYRRFQICQVAERASWQLCSQNSTFILFPVCALFFLVCIV